ncbi:MAG: hypothetical protein QOK10_1768 [Pseudonocardiales bacterium]|nr:hypothetical protein [Pseudonocardiales bacterium]
MSAEMIDIVDALDLLEACVADRGADYCSSRRAGSATSRSERFYDCPAPADSIVGFALTKAGVPPAAVDPLGLWSIAELHGSQPGAVRLTLGALVVLRAAESADRLGQAWGSCVRAALRAVPPFLELIPERAW